MRQETRSGHFCRRVIEPLSTLTRVESKRSCDEFEGERERPDLHKIDSDWAVTAEKGSVSDTNEGRWLLLIYQLPPKPDYFRVKIWRRIQRLGAGAIKNSVYVLPKNDQAQEDFQWVLREISEGGGDASL